MSEAAHPHSLHSLGMRNDDANLLESEATPGEQSEAISLIENSQTEIHPKTINAIIRRTRLLIIRFISDEVEEESLVGKEGILNPEVVASFARVAGDFEMVVPFALLESKKLFERDAEVHESGLNTLRALACEVLARRVVARSEKRAFQGLSTSTSATYLSLTKKFTRIDDDGDLTVPTSALESAVDQHSITFLSSSEVQHCTDAMWKGKLIRRYDEKTGNAYYAVSDLAKEGGFWAHFDPVRLGVPRNSYYLSIASFMFFLVLYTISTRVYKGLDIWEMLLWLWAVGFISEDISHYVKIRGIDAVSLWIVMDLATDVLLGVSFFFRIASFITNNEDSQIYYQLKAFQWLACLAPLLWLQVLKAADLVPYLGRIFIILLKMLKETSIFVILLVLNAVGFAQALWALDAADGKRVDEAPTLISDGLIQAFLGGPDFDLAGENFGKPFGKYLYYAYTFIVMLILANILVAFFGEAYNQVTENADDMFKSYFAEKTISLSRAPDEFVYISPFNLIEAILIAPLEYVVPRSYYVKLNRAVQYTIFFIPLFIIACYESYEVKAGAAWKMKNFDGLPEEFDREQAIRDGDGEDSIENPKVPKEEGNKGEISKCSWKDLVAKLPDIEDDDENAEHEHQDGSKAEEEEKSKGKDKSDESSPSNDAALSAILQELKALRKEVDQLRTSQK